MQHWVMYICPICQAEMPYEIKRHIKQCELLEMGLLADQLTPEVEELPAGFVPVPDVPWDGGWRG